MKQSIVTNLLGKMVTPKVLHSETLDIINTVAESTWASLGENVGTIVAVFLDKEGEVRISVVGPHSGNIVTFWLENVCLLNPIAVTS